MTAKTFQRHELWEVHRSPVWEDYVTVGTPFDRKQHREVTVLHQINQVKERLVREGVHNAEGLGVVLFRETGRMSVVWWVYRPGEGRGPGLFQEIAAIPMHPARYLPDGKAPLCISHRFLRRALRPRAEQAKELRRQRQEFHEKEMKSNEAYRDQRNQTLRYLKKTEGSNSIPAVAMEQGRTPVAPVDDEQIRLMTEILSTAGSKPMVTKTKCIQPDQS